MPVTKKQGAIFAIYADSPEVSRRPTSSSVGQSSNTNPSPTARTRKRAPTERKALSTVAVKPTALRDAKIDGIDKGKKPAISNADVKKPAPVLVARKTLSTNKREVSTSVRLAESPSKKTRSTPVKRTVIASEAVAAIEGSPASRIRSKTAATPLRGLSASGTRKVVPEQSVEDVAVPSDLEDHFGDLVGDGRGALNARKGRTIGAYLRTKETGHADSGSSSTAAVPTRIAVMFEEVPTTGSHEMDSENIPPAKVERRTPRTGRRANPSKVTEGTPGKGRARAVLGDQPLSDVSEAYGASGIEPIGFRDVPKCESGLFAYGNRG